MDIFSEIEGLKQENLTSAVLRYLIINSQEIRECMISLLSEHSPIGPFSFSSHFSCQTEYPTTQQIKDQKEEINGWLDLLIQLDDVVIGIENKINAVFQNDQPRKYIKSIKDVAGALSKINNTEVRGIIFVLCPEDRKTETDIILKDLESSEVIKSAVITWESVLNSLESLDKNAVSNPVVKVLKDEFVIYLKRTFGFIDEFEKKEPHLRNKIQNKGSSIQTEFVGRLWSFFNIKPNSKMGRADHGIGYYFYTNSSPECLGWFGLVSSDTIIESQTDNQTELIIATTDRKIQIPDNLSQDLQVIEIKVKKFLPEEFRCWKVNFNKTWNNVGIWRDKLKPFQYVEKEG